MLIYALLLSYVFVITMLPETAPGAGWFWDLGNGLGFVAIAALFYLTVGSAVPLDTRRHQRLGYLVLAIATAHAFWLLLGDAAVVEYLRPDAPLYMWAGLLSLILLGVLISVALVPDRLRVHRSHGVFRYWHQMLAITTIVTACYHLIGSAYYLTHVAQMAVMVALAAMLSLSRRIRLQLAHQSLASEGRAAALSLLAALLFAAIRNLGA